MIPLGMWLQQQGVECEASDQMVDLLLPNANPLDPEVVNVDRGFHEDVGRLMKCEESLATALQQLAEERASAVAREAQLLEQLGEQMIAALSESITSGLVVLQNSIENAIVDALTPFLETAVVRMSAKELVSSLRHAIVNSADPPIVVKVPRWLHPLLSAALDEITVPVIETDTRVMEVIFSSEKSRFEELSRHWALTISGGLE